MSNYAIETDLKGTTRTDTPKFAKKADLASLKSIVHKIDTDQPETALIDFRKLIKVVKNGSVENTIYGELAKKVNVIQTIDTSNSV